MKQVIIIRKDLNMRKGKMVAQGAHASMAVFFNRLYDGMPYDNFIKIQIDSSELKWINGIFTKVCVGVNSLEELLDIYNKAKEKQIPTALITDCGRTEFHGEPTETAVAVGPADEQIIDAITGDLKLL